MIVYQTYDTVDMAGSDSWHPTFAKAVAHVLQCYEVKGPIKLDATGEWEGEDNGGASVHIERHNIVPTREGICAALQHLPLR